MLGNVLMGMGLLFALGWLRWGEATALEEILAYVVIVLIVSAWVKAIFFPNSTLDAEEVEPGLILPAREKNRYKTNSALLQLDHNQKMERMEYAHKVPKAPKWSGLAEKGVEVQH